jgi:xanthine dehydrogenase accessory factor
VTLVTEIWDAARLAGVQDGIVARPLPGRAAPMPLALRRIVADVRGKGVSPAPAIMGDWFVEPVAHPERPVWIYGAGHVGRAIASVLAPLPDLDVTLIDTGSDRFPDPLPEGVTDLVATNPADLVAHAPETATHLILTYSHALDLEICHRLLQRPFSAAGLIGSATKWARFQRRLAALGHGPTQIARIQCPIGEPALGKHPQAIALGVAAELLRPVPAAEIKATPSEKDRAI